MIWNVTVGTTTTALGATDINLASKIILTNDSDAIIYIGINWSAIMNKGIRLNANWDRIILENEANWLNVLTINAICTAWSKILSYQTI
jgi:hypothetical protein